MSIDMNIFLLIAVGLVHPVGCVPAETSVLDIIAELIANRPSYSPYIPSAAYEADPKTEAEQIQFNRDQKYERQIELILGDLHVQLMGTRDAQHFFNKVSVYGLPSYDNLRFYENFMLSYNQRLKQPNWALEVLEDWHFKNKSTVRPSKAIRFYPDLQVHKYFRSTQYDYVAGSYDRGHFAPACDNKLKQTWLNIAYVSTNTAPQASNLNRDTCVWARLERYVSYLAFRSKNTYVITGALYKPLRDRRDLRYRVIGLNRIAVPTHFYKVILYEDKNNNGNLSLEAFAVPNSRRVGPEEGLEQARIKVDDLDKLEGLSGLKFFDILDRSHIAKPLGYRYGFKEVIGK